MAKAKGKTPSEDMKQYTDCMYFVNGHCKLNDQCRYRHCEVAVAQMNNCRQWPKTCRNVQCRYRHPAPPPKKKPELSASTSSNVEAKQTIAKSTGPTEGIISFFWDIENVPIPRGQKPFDIVQRIRDKLVVGTNLREFSFSCYCNSTTISQENQLSLHHGNVRIVHIPDRKPGAVDRQIMLDLDRYERAHRPPATVVLISGDIDFVGKLSDLRHQAGFHVIVIHNKPAKDELKATVNEHYPWEAFTRPETASSGSRVGKADNAETSTTKPTASANNRRADPSKDRQSKTRKTAPPNAAEPIKQVQKCPQCTAEFESVGSLRQHQEAKGHTFECLSCDEKFFTPDGLVQHKKAKNHFSEVFSCEQCGLQFVNFQLLNQHRQAFGHLNRGASSQVVGGAQPLLGIPPPANTTQLSSEDLAILAIQSMVAQFGGIFKK